MIERRQAIGILGGAAFMALTAETSSPAAKSASKASGFSASDFHRRIAGIEAGNSGRLGVAMLDTATGTRFAYRGDERFPMCSTFKFLLAGAVLARVGKGQERLDRDIAYSTADLVSHSPVTGKFVDKGSMTVRDLCHATMTTSDNAAANLLLASLGGPASFNAFLRTLGDGATRLDRTEPALNEALPGDPRDTTTPYAMLGDLDRLLVGKQLTPASRDTLMGWLVANTTGGRRLRAGLPARWRVGDKTGTGERGTANDVGIFWPEGRAPVLVASYLTGSTASADANNAVHAEVARVIVEAIGASA